MTTVLQHEFYNDKTRFFEGFYESYLLSSESDTNLTELLQDSEHPYEYEIDYEPYTIEVCETFTDFLSNACIDDIDLKDRVIQKIVFKELDSPKFYNYGTDKIVLSIDFDMDKLKAFCLDTNKIDFNLYLKDNYTSHSGYWSFIANNIIDFKNQMVDDDRCINVMLEYYMLRCKYDMATWEQIATDRFRDVVNDRLYDRLYEIQINNSREVTEVSTY